MGEPVSSVNSSASSPDRPAIAVASRAHSSPRSAGGRLDQSVSSKACRAAVTAASMSAADAAGTDPMRSCERGDTTSKTAFHGAGSHLPPM